MIAKKQYSDRWWSSDDGLRLYARDYPAQSGKVRLPVICLHGLTRNSADFNEVAPYVARLDRRVLVADIRGRGLSEYDPNPQNYQPLTYARDIIDLCDSMGIAKAHFIGTSMGGIITMVVALMRPDLIASTVLNDVGPYLNSEGVARIATAGGRKTSTFKTWAEAADYAKLRNGVAFPNYNDADWMNFARRVFQKTPSGRLRTAYDPALFEAFKTTSTPAAFDMGPAFLALAKDKNTLLIRGVLSDLIGEAEAARMQALAPDLKCVDVDNIGHAPMLDEPLAKEAIETFLDQQK